MGHTGRRSFIGGLTRGGVTGTAFDPSGPALGGIMVIPFVTKRGGAVTQDDMVRFPFAVRLIAGSGHHTGANATTVRFHRNTTTVIDATEAFTADTLYSTTNENRAVGSETSRRWISAGTAPLDGLEGPDVGVATRIRNVARGDDYDILITGIASVKHGYTFHLICAPRQHNYTRDDTHQGATIASGVSEPYNSSKD